MEKIQEINVVHESHVFFYKFEEQMKKSTSYFAQILWIDNFPVTWMNFPANSKSIYLLKYALWNLKLNNSGQPIQ